MRPHSSYGRGSRVQQAQFTVGHVDIPLLKSSITNQSKNPLLVSRAPLSEDQIEREIDLCRKNEVAAVKAVMTAQLDTTQRRAEQSKLILRTGFEEQCALLTEMNEKKIAIIQSEHEKLLSSLLAKHATVVKELEANHEGRVKSLMEQMKEVENRENQAKHQFTKSLEKAEENCSKKINEIKKKQKEKFALKIEKTKAELENTRKLVERISSEKEQLEKELETTKIKVLECETQILQVIHESAAKQEALEEQLNSLIEINYRYEEKIAALLLEQQSYEQQQLVNQKEKQIPSRKEQGIFVQKSPLKSNLQSADVSLDEIEVTNTLKDEQSSKIKKDIEEKEEFEEDNNQIEEENSYVLQSEEKQLVDLEQLQSEIQSSIRNQILHIHNLQSRIPFNQENENDDDPDLLGLPKNESCVFQLVSRNEAAAVTTGTVVPKSNFGLDQLNVDNSCEVSQIIQDESDENNQQLWVQERQILNEQIVRLEQQILEEQENSKLKLIAKQNEFDRQSNAILVRVQTQKLKQAEIVKNYEDQVKRLVSRIKYFATSLSDFDSEEFKGQLGSLTSEQKGDNNARGQERKTSKEHSQQSSQKTNGQKKQLQNSQIQQTWNKSSKAVNLTQYDSKNNQDRNLSKRH